MSPAVPPRARRIALAAAAATLALIGSAMTQIAIAPEHASAAATNYLCDNDTVYGIVGTGSNAGDLMQISATDGSATRVGSLAPGTNALGMTKNGTQAWAFQSGSSTAVTTDAASGTTSTVTVGGSVAAIRGAVDPVGNVYYYASSGTPSVLYAYDIDTATAIGEVGTIGGGKGGNGDMAFGTDGTLYLVDSDQVFAVRNVPATAGTGALAATQIATLPAGTNSPGIAYSADGYLYLVANTTSSTLYKIDPGTGVVKATLTISTGAGIYDLASCNYANSLRAQADVRSRAASTDQFTVTNTGFTTGNSATTSGTALGVQSAVAGPNLAVGLAVYTVTQTGSGTTDLSRYSVAWACVNTTSSTTIASGSGNTASFTYPRATTADGSDVLCTFRDAVKPVAVDDTGSTPANTRLDVPAAGVLANDTGASLTVVTTGGQTSPAHGTVTRAADGSYAYTPDTDYSGPDAFGYTVADVNGATAAAQVALTVTPTAGDDTATTGAGTPITLSGLTADDHGTGLAIVSATQPAHGGTTVIGGAVRYTPAVGFVGADSFTYTVEDASHQSATAVVRVTVQPGAADDTATTAAGSPVTTAILTANDHGVLTARSIGAPSHGTARLNPDGTATYTPAAGFSGTDRFAYTATDAGGASYTANVDVTVTPAIIDADPTTTRGTPVTVDAAHGLLAGAQGSGLSAALAAPPAHGSVVVRSDGSYTYTPGPGFVGDDSFRFTVTDASGQSATGSATVTVVELATAALARTGLDGARLDTVAAAGGALVLLGLLLVGVRLRLRSRRAPRHRAA